MGPFERLGRRAFIARVGTGMLGIAVVGVASACGDGGAETTTPRRPTPAAPRPTGATTTTSAATTTATPGTTTAGPTTTSPSVGTGITVERVNLGFVSAYVLVDGTEAAIVDTGVGGSEGAIEESLRAVGRRWSDVGHVILTHLHNDHIGSIGAVLAAATDATGYAGAADIPSIPALRPLTAVATGDTVFGLGVISTPGHTPGHVSVYDPRSGVLVAGDAINGAGSGLEAPGGVAGPNPGFTPDMDTATGSVAALAALDPTAIYFGHGEPLLTDAAAALRTLAGS
jgi:glyoxylase-like metal-dependent hydrolase (beta-lactamase superfamily II)